MTQIAPSLLAADFARLGEAIHIIQEGGTGIVHVDVMDGHFVPDITVGQPVIRSLRKATDLTLDVHLLIDRPERYAAQFVEAGADCVTLHVEATAHLSRVVEEIRSRGAKAGVALNPATPVESLAAVLGEVDSVLVLTADPGWEERAFIPRSIAKVQAVALARQQGPWNFSLKVEGGIGLEHLDALVRAGADILVMGSAIFHSDHPKDRLREALRLVSSMPQTSNV
jgi:ribulose-phosphate 3-epimerase